MQEQMPVKKTRPIFDRRSIFFSIMTLTLFSILVVLILRKSSPGSPASVKQKTSAGWTPVQMRDYANKLKSDGLVDQAVDAYEEYLEKGDVDGPTRAKIYFSIGEMLLNASRYEDALSYFYKSETVDPNSPLKKEIGSYIVTCLERLGRGLDAEYQLESRVNLEGEEKVEKAPGEVVARIGLREITMGEINARLEKLPPWMKDEFTKTKEKKLEFVQHYVAHELLFDKGMKLGIHRDPKIREQLQDVKKQIIIEQVINQEITGKIHPEPDDLKNYYEAHKKNYEEPRKVKFKQILVDKEDTAQAILKRLSGGESFESIAKAESQDKQTKDKGGLGDEWLTEKDPIPGVGLNEDFTKILFDESAGTSPKVVQSKKGFHVVSVAERKAPQAKPFEAVAEQVEFDYRRDKEAVLTQELLMNLVNSKEVQIFSDQFMDKKESADQSSAKENPNLPKEAKT